MKKIFYSYMFLPVLFLLCLFAFYIFKKEKEVTIHFVGDLMCVSTIRGWDIKTMPKRLNNMLSNVKPILTNADLTVGNLESPVANTKPIVKSLRFNAPITYLTALTNVGFDIVSFANNHSCDQGIIGIKETLSNLDNYGIKYTGVSIEPPAIFGTNRTLYVKEKGIKLAFIAYTYALNGRTDGRNCINVADWNYKYHSQILWNIAVAKLRVDAVILMLHWGREYQTNYEPWQKKRATRFIEYGADIIIGSHSHVPQPIEVITTRTGKQGIVAYSLGNFIGAKVTPPEALIGTILRISIKKDTIRIKEVIKTKTTITGKLGNRVFEINIKKGILYKDNNISEIWRSLDEIN